MNRTSLDRRSLLAATGAGLLGATVAAAHESAANPKPFRFGLNMSTIRGQKLSAEEEVDVAGKAGYDAIEPWIRKLREYKESGKSLKDLGKRIKDHGLTVESAIGFAPWIVDDDEKRKKGLEEAKRDMEMLAEIGGIRIAAPPAGAKAPINPARCAERYRKLLELGDETGVVPQIEMWGGHSTIGKVSTAIQIALMSGHPKACFLGDVYHAYKGGSPYEGLRLLSPQCLQVYHFNDYPADPPRSEIKDKDRVYPGDGIAPIKEILQHFRSVGAAPVLSLELFNPEYWKVPALEAAKTGLEKMKACVAKI